MKYSEKVYTDALVALAKLRQGVTDSEKHTIDFIAEAVAEKGNRDHPRTNADRLRSMNDEDLALELFDFRFDGYGKACGAESILPDSQKKILEWLKKPEVG